MKFLFSRKMFALTFSAVILIAMFSPGISQAAKRFTDVPSWAEDAVSYLVENGSVGGYPDGTFRPYQGLTRAQAAKILAISLGLDIDDEQKSTFVDAKDNWASTYIAALHTQREDVIKGYPDGTFRPNASITRAQLAKMIVEAYDLEWNKEASVHFSDVPDWAAHYIYTLGSLGIVEGPVKGEFHPSGNVTRVQMAAILHRTEVEEARLAVPLKKPLPAIDHVTVFNETKFEVTFSSALNEDIAAEIEQSGKRFVVYIAGQSVHSSSAIQSQTISFNEDYTRAAVILAEDTIKADVNYTVALLDGDNQTVSNVVETFTPVLLKKGAEQPEVVVDGEQNKLILKFNEKMSSSALDAHNYKIYGSNQLKGSLAEYIISFGDDVAKGNWVDSTEKTAVEFILNKNSDGKKFSIGETYKIVVSNLVETAKGAELSEVQRTIRMKIPTLSDARPTAKFARIVDQDLIITFDKNLSKAMLNPQLVVVKKPSGHTIPVVDVELANEDNHLGEKEVKFSVAEGYTLEEGLSYTIDLPSNMVANIIFPNALNQEVSGLVAQAQKDIEVNSVSAQLLRQSSHKGKADLLLTFDQRVDVLNLMILAHKAISIKDRGVVYQLVDATEMELYYGDTTGKTVMIKDVEAVFKQNGHMEGKGFKPRSGKNYVVELAPHTVKTENGVTVNQEKLLSSFTGVSISEPELDKILIASADEIVVSFKEEIDAKNLRAHHIMVQGYEKYKNGNFTVSPILLTGNSQIIFNVNGKELTLKPANPQVKFVTHAAEKLFSIQGDVIKGKKSGVENTILTSTDHIDPINIIDRALPIMIGAQKEEVDSTITITYSEPIAFKGNSPEIQASQFSVENATKNAYGMTAILLSPSAGYSSNVMITFNKTETFKPDLDLEKVRVIYSKNNNGVVRDEKGNTQDAQTIIGLKRRTNFLW